MSKNPDMRPALGGAGNNGQLDSLEFVRASLAGVQTNVFLADPKFRIVYANDRAMETLRGLEDELRSAFGLDAAEDVVGDTIQRFHKDRKKIERILRNPSALPAEMD